MVPVVPRQTSSQRPPDTLAPILSTVQDRIQARLIALNCSLEIYFLTLKPWDHLYGLLTDIMSNITFKNICMSQYEIKISQKVRFSRPQLCFHSMSKPSPIPNGYKGRERQAEMKGDKGYMFLWPEERGAVWEKI